MRIAGRRPWTASLALHQQQLRLVLAAAALGVAAIAVAMPLSARGGGERPETIGAPLTMADALGIGGLAALSIDEDVDATTISAFDDNQVLAYYGTPRQPNMGILGEHEAESLAGMLSEHASRFDVLNGDVGITPALHVVYAVAQPETARDGLYLSYVDERTVRSYLALARRHGFALVIDLQIGHSTALAEVEKVLPYLAEPDVHLALDPEFALAGRAKPGEAVGAIDATDINAVQHMLESFTREHNLPKKMLIIHQFQVEMIANTAAIDRSAGVDLVINMDGYGPADIKAVKYRRYGAADYAPFGGIKIFLQHDPDPMSERQILEIEPRPSFIMYQ